MSDRGSPADHADQGLDQSPPADAPATDQPAAPAEPSQPTDGSDAKQPAASSPAEGATKAAAKPTLADVVKSAVEGKEPQGKSPAPVKDGKEKVEPVLTDAEKAQQAEETKRLHNHPRWQEMTGQNRQLKEQVQSLTPDAEQFRKIDTFMRENNLTPDEVGEGFIIMAMLKNNDPRILQKLDDARARAALALGEALPADIQAKVDTGEISEAVAKEMSKQRASVTRQERQLADREAADLNRQRSENAQRLANAQGAAVSAWEAEARKTDPDFAKKEPAIERYARALMQKNGFPRTPEDAVALMKVAKEEVDRDFSAAIPPKAPVRRQPIAPSSNGAKPVPKTLREAIEQAARAPV